MEHRHLWSSRCRQRRAIGAWLILGPAAAAALFGALGTAADERSPRRGANETQPQRGANETQPRSGADETIWKTIFRGTTEVNVVNVDVVVTDRDGRPVSGLTQADFELFDGKRQVEISNFYAVTDGETVPLVTLERGQRNTALGGTGTAPAEPQDAARDDAADWAAPAVEQQPLHLILYVDNVNLKPANRGRVFDQIREFLLAQRRLGAHVMLMSNERSLVVRQGFTTVPHEIFVALAEVEKTAAASPRFDADRRDLLRAIEKVNVEEGSGLFATKDFGVAASPNSDDNTDQRTLTNRTAAEAERLLPQIQAYSRQRLQHTLDTLGVLHQLVGIAAGLPGRKSVLYVSDGLSLKPGEAIYEAYSRRFEALSDVGARVHIQAETARDDAAPQLQALLDHANASRVTFYTLDASPPESLSYGAAESDIGSGGNFGAWNDSMAAIEEYNEQQSLRLLAQGTGGRFGRTEASWNAVLQGVATDFDNYYSLGFVADRDADREVTPEGGKRGKRRLEVKVRGKRLVVRHRSSFQNKPVTTRTAERTRAALLIDELENPFEVTLATDQPQPQDDGTYLVPLAVRIPLGKLVLVPGKTEHQGRVSMFVAVRDEKGRTSEVNRHLCPIRIPNADVLTALGQSASCGLRLVMRRGPQRIAVSVLDELTSIDSTVHLALDVGADEQTAEIASSR